MPRRPWILAECTWTMVRDTPHEVAILPWGATEAHNYHLPYATDNIEAEQVAAESARLAWQGGGRIIVLPAIPFGVNTGQLDIPLCINMMPSTQGAVLRDVCRSLEGSTVRKLVVLNGHGGNDFRQMIRELQLETKLFLCAVNWWTVVSGKEHFEEPGDHAGELETSVVQYLAPELVAPLTEAGHGRAYPFRISAFREGWAWAPRAWTQATDDTGVGDPAHATAAKGERFFRAVTEKIGGFLGELAVADPASMYER